VTGTINDSDVTWDITSYLNFLLLLLFISKIRPHDVAQSDFNLSSDPPVRGARQR
jgi:hypothetical protein